MGMRNGSQWLLSLCHVKDEINLFLRPTILYVICSNLCLPKRATPLSILLCECEWFPELHLHKQVFIVSRRKQTQPNTTLGWITQYNE